MSGAERSKRAKTKLTRSFRSAQLSNTAWALVTLRNKRIMITIADTNSPPPSLSEFEKAEDENIRRAIRVVIEVFKPTDAKPQELSNLVWALASSRFGEESESDFIALHSLMDKVALAAMSQLYKFQPQGESQFNIHYSTPKNANAGAEINNMAWAFARLNHPHPPLFEKIAEHFKKHVNTFSAQDISATVWSFATLKFGDLGMFESAAKMVTEKSVQNFKPQECSNILWSFATMNCLPISLKILDREENEIAAKIKISMDILDKRDNNNNNNNVFVNAYAAIANELIKRPYAFKDQELKDVLWSFSKACFRHPTMFRATGTHLLERTVASFSPQCMSNMVWAFAKVNERSERAL